jgi:hypothetical protein
MGSRRNAGDAAHDPSNGSPRAGGNEPVIELQAALRLCRQVQDEVRGSGGVLLGGSAGAAAGSAAVIRRRCALPPHLGTGGARW